MRVFSLFVAFVFSAAGISAFAATDAISTDDDINVVAVSDGNTSVISNEISERDLSSNISLDDSLNTEDKDEGDDKEDSKGEDKLSYMFAEVDVENAKGEQAEGGDQAVDAGQVTTEEANSEAAPQQEEEVVADDKPSRWSLYVEFWEEDKFDKGSLETYATIRPQYQLTDKLRLGFSFESTVQWAAFGNKKTTEYKMGDHYLMLGTSTALGPFDLYGYMRIYLPTSETTMAIGRIARVRIKPYLTFPVSRNVKFAFRLETNYFQHTVDSFRNAEADTNCNSAQYCSDVNEQWRIEPLAGFLGKIYGPFSFESIHGFRFHSYFENNTVDTKNQKKGHEVKWYNESGVTWDVNIGGVPVTFLAGFYDHRATGGSFLKRLPIVSYFTGPHEESYWVFSIWASI